MESNNRHFVPSQFHQNISSKPTGRSDIEGFTTDMSRISPPDHRRNRPPFFRGGSSTDSSSSTSSSGAVSHGTWPALAYSIDEDRENLHFRSVSDSKAPESYRLPAISSPSRASRHGYPNVLNSDSDERIHNPRSRGAQPSSKVEFFTWKNLPPRRMLEACFTAYFGPSGLSTVLCPYPPSEAWSMLRAVFSAAASGGSGGGNTGGGGGIESGYAGGDSTFQTSSANSQLCQVLLIAAVGSQNLSSHEMVSAEMSEALFTSGKWYLNVMFGRDADEFQKLRANTLCGLCSIFNKNIKGKEHIGQSIFIFRYLPFSVFSSTIFLFMKSLQHTLGCFRIEAYASVKKSID